MCVSERVSVSESVSVSVSLSEREGVAELARVGKGWQGFYKALRNTNSIA